MIVVIVYLLAVFGLGAEVDAAEEDIVVSRKTGGWDTALPASTMYDSSAHTVEVFGTPRYQARSSIQEEQKVYPKIEELECISISNITTILPELSIWIEALNAANLTNIFEDPKFKEATYLIPTNDAFLAFFDYLGVDKEAALADPQMKLNQTKQVTYYCPMKQVVNRDKDIPKYRCHPITSNLNQISLNLSCIYQLIKS